MPHQAQIGNRPHQWSQIPQPELPAGLEKSSRTSLRHGLTSRNTILLACENRDDFDRMLADYTATYQPATAEDTDLVKEMVAARWRIQRFWLIETALLDLEMLQPHPEFDSQCAASDPGLRLAHSFRVLADQSRSLHLISRYESRLHRIHTIARRALLESRKEKVRNEPTAPLTPVESIPARPRNPHIA